MDLEKWAMYAQELKFIAYYNSHTQALSEHSPLKIYHKRHRIFRILQGKKPSD